MKTLIVMTTQENVPLRKWIDDAINDTTIYTRSERAADRWRAFTGENAPDDLDDSWAER